MRTYAPRGRPPVLRVPLTRDHLAVISAITPEARLLLAVQARPVRGPDVVRFLQHLLRHLPGPLLVIWDGAPIHRSRPVQDFLAAGGAERLHLAALPGYAPDLNPDEGIWQYLKRRELANQSHASLVSLRDALYLAIARLRHKPSIIHSCFRHARYRL